MAEIGLMTILSLVGTGISTVGTISSINAASAAASYNAELADRDAVVANQNRRVAIETANIEADQARRDSRRNLASIRAAYGANGVSLAGTPLDVLSDAAQTGEQDAQRIEYEGFMRGREGAFEAQSASESAALSRLEARQSGRAWQALGGAASGAGTALQRMA